MKGAVFRTLQTFGYTIIISATQHCHFRQVLLSSLSTTDIVFANHCYHLYQTLQLFSRHIINITAIRHHYFCKENPTDKQRVQKMYKAHIYQLFRILSQFCKIAFLFCFRNVMNHALTLYRQYEAQYRLPTIRCEEIDFLRSLYP